MGSTYFPPNDNYGRPGFKRYLVTFNWSSREEEEEEISKSLRHFEMSNDGRNSVSDSQVCVWDEEEQTKCCLSGDIDTVIPATSTRYNIDAPKLPTISPWRAWYDQGQASESRRGIYYTGN